MRTRIAVVLTVLALAAASAASATSVEWTKTVANGRATYTYTLTSTESSDFITSFHIFAPLSADLVEGYTAPEHWSFRATPDPDPNVGLDIAWYAIDPQLYGISNNSTGVFSLTVPSCTSTYASHTVPGCFGNWGYETKGWPGVLVISCPSVAVPGGQVPEPVSMLTLGVGCVIAAAKRRRS